ncbi:MAG: hypothetical protein RRY55_06685 [Bacteroidales bacterium]
MNNREKSPFSWDREDTALQNVFKKIAPRIPEEQSGNRRNYVQEVDRVSDFSDWRGNGLYTEQQGKIPYKQGDENYDVVHKYEGTVSGNSFGNNYQSDKDNLHNIPIQGRKYTEFFNKKGRYDVPFSDDTNDYAFGTYNNSANIYRVNGLNSNRNILEQGEGPLMNDPSNRSYNQELRKSVEQGFPVSWRERSGGQYAAPYQQGETQHHVMESDTERGQTDSRESQINPSTVSTFLEGMKLFVPRFKNDFNYLVGKVGSMVNREEKIPDILDAIESKTGALESLPIEHVERLINEVSKEKERIGYAYGVSEHGYSAAAADNSATLSQEHSILSTVAQMKRSGATPKQVGEYIRNIRINGGASTQMMKNAQAASAAMPEARGWARVGDIASSIVQGAVPVAAGIVYPPLGIALGAASVSSMVGQSVAEANMELDGHEQQTGEKIPDWQRNIYASTVAGVDMLLGGLMQSHYLKGVSAPLFTNLRKGIIGRVVMNDAAQKEIGSLMGMSAKSIFPSIGKEVVGSALMQGASGSASSVTRDLISLVYKNPEQYPTLTEILGNAFESGAAGVVTGGMLGSVRSVGGRAVQPLRRNMNGRVPLLDDMYGDTYEYIGTHPTTGQYLVMDAKGRQKYINFSATHDPRVMDVASFNEASKKPYSLAIDLSRDVPEFPDLMPKSRFKYPDRLWLEDDKTPNIKGFKHTRVKDISMRIGVRPKIYDTVDDVPKSIRAGLSDGDNTVSFYDPKTKEVGVIISNIRRDEEVETGLLRNGVVNKGIRAVLGDETDGFLEKIYERIPVSELDDYNDLPTKKAKASAYLGDMARDSKLNPSLWQQVSQSLRGILRHNFGIGDMGEDDLRYLIWKAKNRIKADDTIEEMRQKTIEDKRMIIPLYGDDSPIK